MNTINAASREWASRPDDHRYTSMADLKRAVQTRRQESWTVPTRASALRMVPPENGKLLVETYDPTKGQKRLLSPTHWSFGQLSSYASCPAGFLREQPSELAAIILQWNLENRSKREDTLLLAHSNGDDRLRAMTGISYGRIWDAQVVDAVEKVNVNERWKIPVASYTTTNPKRATTLYASDRDIFIFLVDPENPIEVNGEQMFRGFYTWNSEVGDCTFGICTFLYRYVCDNRIIWGASEIQELRIRHTRGAPERFAYEGAEYLTRYANESTLQISEGIKRAQNTDVPLNRGKDETVESWLQSRGFTKAQAKASSESALAEQGSNRSIWDIVNGITAYARSVPHTNERVELERAAGSIMDDVTK